MVYDEKRAQKMALHYLWMPIPPIKPISRMDDFEKELNYAYMRNLPAEAKGAYDLLFSWISKKGGPTKEQQRAAFPFFENELRPGRLERAALFPPALGYSPEYVSTVATRAFVDTLFSIGKGMILENVTDILDHFNIPRDTIDTIGTYYFAGRMTISSMLTYWNNARSLLDIREKLNLPRQETDAIARKSCLSCLDTAVLKAESNPVQYFQSHDSDMFTLMNEALDLTLCFGVPDETIKEYLQRLEYLSRLRNDEGLGNKISQFTQTLLRFDPEYSVSFMKKLDALRCTFSAEDVMRRLDAYQKKLF